MKKKIFLVQECQTRPSKRVHRHDSAYRNNPTSINLSRRRVQPHRFDLGKKLSSYEFSLEKESSSLEEESSTHGPVARVLSLSPFFSVSLAQLHNTKPPSEPNFFDPYGPSRFFTNSIYFRFYFFYIHRRIKNL